MKKSIFGALSAAVIMGTTAQAGTIDTTGAVDAGIFTWGLADTATYGQTFRLDQDATINSFTFFINDDGIAIAYDALIYAFDFDTLLVTGPELYRESGSTAGNGVTTGYTAAVNGVQVMANTDYAIFFHATSVGDATWDRATDGSAYMDGQLIFQNNGGNEANWSTVAWEDFVVGDMGFILEFDEVEAIPVPAAAPLMLAGLGGLGFLRRRKRA